LTNPEAAEGILTEINNLVDTLMRETSAASDVLLHEQQLIAQRVRDFSVTDSRPWHYFVSCNMDKLSVKEFVTIGRAMAAEAHLNIDREAKRRKEVLFRWMDDNWDKIVPILPTLRYEWDTN
jgi:hypothetical protein